jgi:hypothetical protein
VADGETQHPAADPPLHGADDYDRRAESLLYWTMGEIALADGRTDDAQRHCR